MPTTKNKPSYVSLSEEHIALLKSEKQRTGIGAIALFRNAQNIPDGFKVATLESWFTRIAKTARQEYLDFVFQAYKTLPNKGADIDKTRNRLREKYVPITDNYIEMLRSEIRRTGIHGTTLVKHLPSEYSRLDKIIDSWLARKIRTAPQKHLDIVMSALSEFPDKNTR